MFVAIASLPPSAKKTDQRQLAVGGTLGSRHVAARGDVYACDPADTAHEIHAATGCRVDARYIGNVYVSPPDPTADDITHPEHGNQGFPSGTICAVVFQRSLDQLLREQRVAD